jgi:L-ascorbate 6-phosphate lactonase
MTIKMKLADKIHSTKVEKGEIALFYLAQAGFCMKASGNKIVVIDAYLSDAAERLFSFKRMIPAVIKAEEVDADLYLSTHSHIDHLDTDTLPVISKNRKTFFIGSPDCEELYRHNNISKDRYHILKLSEEWNGKGISIKAVYADHGDLAPEAIGMLIDIEGIKIYHAGDTCFSPDKIKASINSDVDIMIAPINGQYGNLNASEACKLAVLLTPKVVIASHFWMFLQHVSEGGVGDPATFLKESEKLPKEIKAMVMAPGELFIYSK